MRHWKKGLLAFAIIASLALVALWAFSQHGVEDIEDARHEDLKRHLFALGAIRLAILPRNPSHSHFRRLLPWQEGRPPQFLFFNHLQKIRQAGFEPVWRDNRYIAIDMITKQELDPFSLSPGKGLNSRKEIDEDDYLREQFSMLHLDDLIFYTYYRQLYGFHLVLRPGGYSGDKLLFVKNVQEKDLEVTLEQLMALDDTITFNCGEQWGHGIKSEAHLKERGFIMKKRGNGHIPVSLETGEMAELPPKQFFVDTALRNINNDAREHGGPLPLMGQRHIYRPGIGSWETPRYRPYYVEKVLLELYGLEIRWNEAERRYEFVQ
jgi:hypothetical protein